MGSCFSCHSGKNNKERFKDGRDCLTKSEIKALLLESIERNIENLKIQEYTNVKEIEKEENVEKNIIDNKNDEIINSIELYNYDYNDDDYNNNDENQTSIDEPKLDKGIKEKRQKEVEESKIHDDYYESENEDLYHKDPKGNPFSPLTLDEILEVLSNNETSEQSFSPLSFSSSLVPDQSEYSHHQSPDDTLEIIDEVEQLENTVNYGRLPAHSDPTHFQSIRSTKNVLNSVPLVYDDFKNKKNKRTHRSSSASQSVASSKSVESEKPFTEKSEKRLTSITSSLSHINELKQNIIHLMVLNNDKESLQTLLECMEEIKLTKHYLDAFDDLLNAPISYAIMQGDTELVELLLKYNPIIPTICFSRFNKSCLPTLHTALRFLYPSKATTKGAPNNLFIVLCEYINSLNNNDVLQDFLEMKDTNNLTILHHMILNYYPTTINMNESTSEYQIKYILNLGASLETKCPCSKLLYIDVDAVGQAVFTEYPCEILKLLISSPFKNKCSIQTRYFIENMEYNLSDLILMRQNSSSETRKSIVELLKLL